MTPLQYLVLYHFSLKYFFQPLLPNIDNILCGVFRKTKLANSTPGSVVDTGLLYNPRARVEHGLFSACHILRVFAPVCTWDVLSL